MRGFRLLAGRTGSASRLNLHTSRRGFALWSVEQESKCFTKLLGIHEGNDWNIYNPKWGICLVQTGISTRIAAR
jgi:hypothetical protein